MYRKILEWLTFLFLAYIFAAVYAVSLMVTICTIHFYVSTKNIDSRSGSFSQDISITKEIEDLNYTVSRYLSY